MRLLALSSLRGAVCGLLLVAACGGPAIGPKVSGASQPDRPSVTTTTEPAPASRQSLGPAPDDLRAVDWKQATLTSSFCGVEGTVRFQDGEARATSTIWGEVGLWVKIGRPVWFGDIDADGREEAAVSLGCDNTGGTGASDLEYGLVIVRSVNGQLELVGEIATTTMRDDAPHVPLLSEPTFEKGAITVKELWYRPNDANCCPSGVSLTRWSLRDGTLKAGPAVQVS